MTTAQFYGYPLPGYEKGRELPGRLIVIEGTDGVGRSTQIALLKEWLEANGYAVVGTGMKRSMLAGDALKAAMAGHTMGDTTMFLLYATDFVDRLQRDILPALRAGFVVLTDRYSYSIIARAQVRGVDPRLDSQPLPVRPRARSGLLPGLGSAPPHAARAERARL